MLEQSFGGCMEGQEHSRHIGQHDYCVLMWSRVPEVRVQWELKGLLLRSVGLPSLPCLLWVPHFGSGNWAIPTPLFLSTNRDRREGDISESCTGTPGPSTGLDRGGQERDPERCDAGPGPGASISVGPAACPSYNQNCTSPARPSRGLWPRTSSGSDRGGRKLWLLNN